MFAVNDHQNAFQHAGENGNFVYNEIGNQSSSFFILILAFILLVALLRSEARNRDLLARLAGNGEAGAVEKESGCCGGKSRKGC